MPTSGRPSRATTGSWWPWDEFGRGPVIAFESATCSRPSQYLCAGARTSRGSIWGTCCGPLRPGELRSEDRLSPAASPTPGRGGRRLGGPTRRPALLLTV
jgi:hypothetical protein